MDNSNIKFLIMDVDGTLTDGKIYLGNDGEMFKSFDVKDGSGIHDILPEHGIVPIVITARNSSIVEKRCKELGVIEIHQNCRNKISKIIELLEKYSDIDYLNGAEEINRLKRYSLSNCAYIGDDILDLQCMIPIIEAGGMVACPADAAEQVMAVSQYVMTKTGGDGAVREFIEIIIGLRES